MTPPSLTNGLLYAFVRRYQEDYVAAKLDETYFPHLYVGVFDGHGGATASEFCANHLHQNILESSHMPADLLTAMQDGYLRTDADILRRASRDRGKQAHVGSAAVTMLVTADALALAHAGDCRALLVKRSGSSLPFVELTCDHSAENVPLPCGKPSTEPMRPDEVTRVLRAGGKMEPGGGYVFVDDHSLPMTRALGDLPLKVATGRSWQAASVSEQVVTALPEVKAHPRADDDLCVVLASDGLFGHVMSSMEVADYVRGEMEGQEQCADAELRTARGLAERAITAHHSCDNVSVAIVSLAPPRPPPPPGSELDGFPPAPRFEQLCSNANLQPPTGGGSSGPLAPEHTLSDFDAAERELSYPLSWQGSQVCLSTISSEAPRRSGPLGMAYPACL